MKQSEGLQARVGQLISGRYKLSSLIGFGSAGAVYTASDKELRDLQVAVKLIYPHLVTDPTSVERFRAEVIIARQLSHPNIVKIFDFGRSDQGEFFIVMELVQGVSLSGLLESLPEKRCALGAAVNILFEISSGVAHAHQRAIVHRDLKPQNILLSNSGLIKICDFGVARQMQSEDALTRTGEAIGTPYYMAPELFRGEEADERTDVYALGIIAYELLSGQRPFAEQTFYELALQHLEKVMPILPPELHLPAWVEEVIAVSTAKERRARFSSAVVLVEKLRPYVTSDSVAQREELYEKWNAREVERLSLEKQQGRRRRGALISLGLLTTLVVLIMITRLNFRQRWPFGAYLLRAERVLGPTLLWPLKRMIGLNVHPTEENLREVVWAALDAPLPGTDKNAEEKMQGYFSVLIRALLDGGVSPNTKDEDGVGLVAKLFEAREYGTAQLFMQREDFDPNQRDSEGTPLIHIAIRDHNGPAVNQLSRRTAFDPNILDQRGNSPLHSSVIFRDYLIFTPLSDLALRTRVQADIKNHAGDTALALAIRDPQFPEDIFSAILSLSNPEMTNFQGETPLIQAVRQKQQKFLRILLKRGVDIRKTDNAGKSAVWYAARAEKLDLFLEFTRKGVKPTDVNWMLGELPDDRREELKGLVTRSVVSSEPSEEAR